MPEKKRQITISRHAIFVNANEKVNDDKSINQPIWWLPIARLYSGDWKDCRKDSREKYGLTTKMAPVSFSRADIDGGEMVYAIQTREAGGDWCKFYVAVRELIIEWNDYQTEVCGSINFPACEDMIDQSI